MNRIASPQGVTEEEESGDDVSQKEDVPSPDRSPEEAHQEVRLTD